MIGANSDNHAKLIQLGLTEGHGAVAVVDLVSSVRQIEQDEFGTITRWVSYVADVKGTVLPLFSGRLVKSLGDGLLIEFPNARLAVEASRRLMEMAKMPVTSLALRIGIEVGEYLSNTDDIYGITVNRAARLMVRANPGQIIVSQAVRDAAGEMCDVMFADHGDGYLKHVQMPVRGFSVEEIADRAHTSTPPHIALAPTLAIIPFQPEIASPDLAALGEILCEELINGFVHSHYLHVIARQSTKMLSIADDLVLRARDTLKADYVLSGKILKTHNGLRLAITLVETHSQSCIAADTYPIHISEEFARYRDILEQARTIITHAIHGRELDRSHHLQLSQVASHAVLMQAINAMHQFTQSAFLSAAQMLDYLQQRESGHPAPFAWKAHWHHLRIQQGWSPDIAQDMRAAREACKKAIDCNPDSSLALAVGGLMAAVIDRRYDVGEHYSGQAINISPSDPRAWLYHGAVHIFSDNGAKAVQSVLRARHLSPLDPYRYMYDSIAASAYFVTGEYENACVYAERAYSQNKQHASTLRVRAASLYRVGRMEEAQMAAAEMMKQEPHLTISGWKRRSPAADENSGRDLCEAFEALGVPA